MKHILYSFWDKILGILVSTSINKGGKLDQAMSQDLFGYQSLRLHAGINHAPLWPWTSVCTRGLYICVSRVEGLCWRDYGCNIKQASIPSKWKDIFHILTKVLYTCVISSCWHCQPLVNLSKENIRITERAGGGGHKNKTPNLVLQRKQRKSETHLSTRLGLHNIPLRSLHPHRPTFPVVAPG